MEVIFKEEFEKPCPGLERFRIFRHKGGKLDFGPRHTRLKPYMPMPPLGVRGRPPGLVMREVSEGGEDLAAKASSCLGRCLGLVMRASLEGALGLKPIPGWMRPALSDFNACQPCLGAREVSVEVRQGTGGLSARRPGMAEAGFGCTCIRATR